MIFSLEKFQLALILNSPDVCEINFSCVKFWLIKPIAANCYCCLVPRKKFQNSPFAKKLICARAIKYPYYSNSLHSNLYLFRKLVNPLPKSGKETNSLSLKLAKSSIQILHVNQEILLEIPVSTVSQIQQKRAILSFQACPKPSQIIC